MKKFLSLFLVLVIMLGVGTAALAATDKTPGKVKVSSEWPDGSLKKVVVTDWEFITNDGLEFYGNDFTVVFPKGYIYKTPTAEDCWKYLIAATDYQASNSSRDVSGWERVVPTTTTAEDEAIARMTDARTELEHYGWTLEWWPSATATTDKATYNLEILQIDKATNSKGSHDLVYYRYTVVTTKTDGHWSTIFRPENGTDQDQAYFQEFLKNKSTWSYDATRPENIVRATTAEKAIDAALDWVESKGYKIKDETVKLGNKTARAVVDLYRGGKYTTTLVVDVDEAVAGASYRVSFSTEKGTLVKTRDVIMVTFPSGTTPNK